MSTISKQYGSLILTFTTSFTLRYKDKGSKADVDGAFWHPNAPTGFFALGGVGVSNYDDINGKSWALCVQPAPEDPTATAHPTDYTQIWKDTGSGADMDGSCWRPVPPAGYKALGDVFVTGYNKPSNNDIVCVREDLVTQGIVGSEIYSDSGSGADMDISVYKITASTVLSADVSKGCIAANCYVANNNYYKPSATTAVNNCLKLPFPKTEYPAPAPPSLIDYNMPAEFYGNTIDHIVYVPFTAFVDKEYDVSWQVQNSPFYTLQREVAYKRELFNYNTSGVAQTTSKSVTSGITQGESTTFEANAGVSTSVTAGITTSVTASATGNYSIDLGWQTSTNVEELREVTRTLELKTPPDTAACLWSLWYALKVLRSDNSMVDSVSFNVDSLVTDQYPDR